MNIKFKLVELADLELLRTHSNHPLTRKWLEFEGLVSSEEQIAWFKSGQSMSFRIIQKDSTKIGLARIKDMSDQFIQIGMDLFIEFRGKRFASSIFKGLVEEVKNNKKDQAQQVVNSLRPRFACSNLMRNDLIGTVQRARFLSFSNPIRHLVDHKLGCKYFRF